MAIWRRRSRPCGSGAFEYLVKPFDLPVAQRVIERAVAVAERIGGCPVAGSRGRACRRPCRPIGRQCKRCSSGSLWSRPSEACVHVVGRKRHGQGTGRPRDSSIQPPRPRPVRRRESSRPSIRRWSRASCSATPAARSPGPIRPHRGLLEQSQRRHDLSRRNGRHLPRPAGQAVAGRRAWRDFAGRLGAADGDRSARRFGDASESAGQGERRLVSPRSLFSAEHVSDRVFRRSAIAATTSALWPSIFCAMLAAKNHASPARLSAEALAELERRPWYGNVRELKNAIEHALILARGG